MKKIFIFSSDECKACIFLKKLLQEENITYIDINKNLPQNKLLWDNVTSEINSTALPLLFIQEENNYEGTAYIADQDWKTYKELIEIIKRNV
jgi:glutaredoxin